jgi:hypothetical protein
MWDLIPQKRFSEVQFALLGCEAGSATKYEICSFLSTASFYTTAPRHSSSPPRSVAGGSALRSRLAIFRPSSPARPCLPRSRSWGSWRPLWPRKSCRQATSGLRSFRHYRLRLSSDRIRLCSNRDHLHYAFGADLHGVRSPLIPSAKHIGASGTKRTRRYEQQI